MIAVISATFLVRWPYLPVDPSTVAGAMFYVCDSHMLETFEDLSRKDKKERNFQIRSTGSWFAYGQAAGTNGKRKMKIDACNWKEIE